ncbi:MAG: GTP-binding protein [Cyanothece sp. SIO1E1]|nr:GTP-binding protein [Cyanothece sp. SIO1E1]
MVSITSKKICLLGDFAVGKTSLIRRFIDRQFGNQYLSTVGIKVSRKTVKLENSPQSSNQQMQLLIWDIEDRSVKAFPSKYLKEMSGAIIVADASRKETIDHLIGYIDLFSTINRQSAIFIALNKTDLVAEKELQTLLSSVSFNEDNRVTASYLISAKADQNVDEIFKALTFELILNS